VNQKKARAARMEVAVQRPAPFWTTGKGILVGVAVVAVIGVSFAVPRLTGGKSGSATHAGMASALGTGPIVGGAPRFRESNVVSGRTISSQTLRGHKTLLFFSEGVMCQACLQQIRDIDDVGRMLAKRHIALVSITPDSPAELKQAIGQYGISSPMISDGNRDMSEAFNMLGKGMHADTPGHAFVLINGRGQVLWQRDYYQPPYRAMYVKPAMLFKDIPA
jgi:peroxiredoxin